MLYCGGLPSTSAHCCCNQGPSTAASQGETLGSLFYSWRPEARASLSPPRTSAVQYTQQLTRLYRACGRALTHTCNRHPNSQDTTLMIQSKTCHLSPKTTLCNLSGTLSSAYFTIQGAQTDSCSWIQCLHDCIFNNVYLFVTFLFLASCTNKWQQQTHGMAAMH